MNYYLDLHLLPDPEFSFSLLMNALFGKLHRGLTAACMDGIGVSFPQHDDSRPTLGEQLRLHGERDVLEGFMQTGWLAGMRDHLQLAEITKVPESVRYRCVRRVQAKSNPDRLRRRYMKRHQVDEQAARKAIPDDTAEYLALPYVTLNSHSTGQRFRLFIAHGQLVDQPVPGTFSHYGLSAGATIPWF